jgi:hypothetical protein
MKILITEKQLERLIGGFLNEDFKTQKIKFIDQGNDESIVDTYLKDFKEIRDRGYSEFLNVELPGLKVNKGDDRKNIDNYKTFKELELIVDYMAGQRKVGNANFEDIKVDGKPIYNDENVEIYYAPNKESCIRYKGDKSYGWCIARSDSSNMFMRYRTQSNRPSFYFVKRKDATDKEFEYWNNSGDKFSGKFKDKWHFFVIQALKNNNYIVTSAMNDGDVKMTWDEILNIAPELEGKENYFESKPLNDTEVQKYEKFKKGISDDEFSKLSYNDKEYYIDTYVSYYDGLTDKQFYYLPEDLKNKYINLGIELTPGQISTIKDNKKLSNRFSEITNDMFEETYVKKVEALDGAGLEKFFKLLDFDHSKYQFLNEKNKKFADYYLTKEIKDKLKRWVEIISWSDDDYFGYVESMVEKNISNNYLPNPFYLKTLIPKEEILQNEGLMKFLFFIYLFLGKELMKEYVNYLGISEESIVNSFKTKKEMKLYNKLIKK